MKEIIICFSSVEIMRIGWGARTRVVGQTVHNIHQTSDILVQPIIDWLEQLNIEYIWFRPIFFREKDTIDSVSFEVSYDVGLKLENSMLSCFEVFSFPKESDEFLFRMEWANRIVENFDCIGPEL